MNSSTSNIACSLTEQELRERRREILQKAGEGIVEIQEIENGYAYRFPSDDTWLNDLTNIIKLERKCCPFLTFNLKVQSGNDSIWLELISSEDTKDFLASFFS
jgi:hypothetical protein